jgi:hypothetical protein
MIARIPYWKDVGQLNAHISSKCVMVKPGSTDTRPSRNTSQSDEANYCISAIAKIYLFLDVSPDARDRLDRTKAIRAYPLQLALPYSLRRFGWHRPEHHRDSTLTPGKSRHSGYSPRPKDPRLLLFLCDTYIVATPRLSSEKS